MSDSAFDREVSCRLAAAYDCWGSRRTLRRHSRNKLWSFDAADLEIEDTPQPTDHDSCDRAALVKRLIVSGRLTATEQRTLLALVEERVTLEEIASRDGCSRQAVMARLVGNSRGQGGLIRKARALLQSSASEAGG